MSFVCPLFLFFFQDWLLSYNTDLAITLNKLVQRQDKIEWLQIFRVEIVLEQEEEKKKTKTLIWSI